MFRSFYIRLVRLHPLPFRQRFAEEMLGTFDEVANRGSARSLFVDVFVSLFRQWVLRSEFRRPMPVGAVAAGSANTPLFSSLESRGPRPAAILNGVLLSVAVLCAMVLAVGRGRTSPSYLIGSHRPGGDLLPIDRASLKGTEPDTLIKFGPDPDNPWRALAAVYFKRIRVLGAIDANRDFVISPWEIVTSPAALRKLDTNRDGKLSAEECGFSLRTGLPIEPDAEFARRARLEFMRSNPVLAALDADHDGEISAKEMLNGSRALRKLDRNGDGFLTPDEVLPDRAATQASIVFSLLDTNHDGRISIKERASEDAERMRELLVSADRNRDGVTTLAELTGELRLREERARQLDKALKAAAAGR
ncbi:MAG: EF-hand domain-containing protein [Bryobacteraceae bacterium]